VYASGAAPRVERATVAAHMAARQTWLRTPAGALSAADMLQVLLGMEPETVDGPATRIASTYSGASIARASFERARADAASFIRANHRLPAAVWIGSEKLSVGDFAATLAADDGASPQVTVRRANLEFEKYVSNEPARSFDWIIHPKAFEAPELLDLARLQAWTIKPAVLH
jgi:hypothetical protein